MTFKNARASSYRSRAGQAMFFNWVDKSSSQAAQELWALGPYPIRRPLNGENWLLVTRNRLSLRNNQKIIDHARSLYSLIWDFFGILIQLQI